MNSHKLHKFLFPEQSARLGALFNAHSAAQLAVSRLTHEVESLHVQLDASRKECTDLLAQMEADEQGT